MTSSPSFLPAPGSAARRAAGALALVVLVAAYVWLQVLPLLGDRGTGIVGLASHQNDFKHVWLGAYLLANDQSPYDPDLLRSMAAAQSEFHDPRFRTILPYVYLPFTGMVFRPLVGLSFAQAAVAFQVLNHVLLLGGLVVAAWGAGWRLTAGRLALLVAAVAFNTVVARQNNAGQLNTVLFFGMAVLYAAVRRGWHDGAVGSLAAALMLFKLSPGIFLPWFLLRREGQRAAWMVGVALGLTALTVLLYGLRVHLEFLPLLRAMGYGRSTWEHLGMTFWRDPYNQSFNALFHRLLVERPGSGIVPWAAASPLVANAISYVAAFAVLGIFARVAWHRGDLESSFSIAVLTSLLVPSILWDHYLVQALLPAVLLFGAGPILGGPALRRVLIVAAVAVMSVPIALDAELFRQGVGLLGMQVKLLPVLLLGAAALLPCGEPASAAP